MSQSVTFAIGDFSVRQLDGLFSLNDLHAAAGGESKHQPGKFTALESTKALVAEIGNSPDSESLRITTGRTGGTYACRELVIAYAAWISAAFHLKVIRVFLAQQTAPAAPALPAPVATSTKTLKLMVITTEGGQSTVEMYPASDLPQMVLHMRDVISTDEAQKIASHANLRMMGDVARMGRDKEWEDFKEKARKLPAHRLNTLACDLWMELGTRTIIENEMGAAA